MSTAQLAIRRFMMAFPYSIQASATLREARARMAEYGVRHLPVMKDDRLMGMLSDRDLKLAYGIKGLNPDAVLVIDACHEGPYVVEPDTSLSEVATVMAEQRYGSAIVCEQGRVVGIFTTVDACRALASFIDAWARRKSTVHAGFSRVQHLTNGRHGLRSRHEV
jgi:acetoin utilization protein AcuB